LAYLAARLMAEEGVTDFAMAKQKAARQTGLVDGRLLPDNGEIEAALREYQGLYQKEDQPAQLRYLREVAARAMRELAQFRPFLIGAVLNGTANQYSGVSLQLFADDSKALALFLLNRNQGFEQSGKRVRIADEWVSVPQFVLDMDGTPITLSVYSPADDRRISRARSDGEAPQRAGLAEVEALLAA
jgi:hypothetical protein